MTSALVTGTNSGIGLATVLALSRAGHRVYATVRDPARAAPLAEAVAREELPVSIITMDVNSDASVRSAIDQVSSDNIDVLVNNAGIERLGSVEELPLDVFRAVMETNYFGVLRCIKAVLPRMRERRNGCIVNISSVAGRLAYSPFAPYNAAKSALEAMSEVLSQEVKPFNVRVAIVEPGIIATPMAERIAKPADTSNYLHRDRMAGLFQTSLGNPTAPAVVAEKICDIIESGTWVLRHPVGLDAQPFLDWRGSMTDEEWVALFASDDDAWHRRMQTDFGSEMRAAK